MFDISKPLLVFDRPAFGEIGTRCRGYIFRLYEFHFRRHKELFFSHVGEARMFALRYGADYSMDPTNQPDIVTALEYVMNHDPMDIYPEDANWQTMRGHHMKTKPGTGKEDPSEAVAVTNWLDEPGILEHELLPGQVDFPEGTIDYFGEDV